MKKHILLFSFFCFLGSLSLSAQSYAFGLKGGITAATQRWNNFDDGQPLFSYHGDVYIESWNEENLSALFASVGYHARGRTVRTRRTVGLNGEDYPSRTFDQRLFNGVLIIGVKKKIPVKNESTRGFYGFGVRGEYNISSDFAFYSGLEDQINKITYGVTVNGGFEFMFSEFVGGVFEISVHPDFGKQLFAPTQVFQDDRGFQRTLAEQNVVNTSIEISVGLRFLHKITYID
jgi:hypothetical protein